jgi:hypothetical protein
VMIRISFLSIESLGEALCRKSAFDPILDISRGKTQENGEYHGHGDP